MTLESTFVGVKLRTWNIIAGLALLGSGLAAHAQVVQPLNSLYGNEEAEGFVKMFDGLTKANFNTNWVDYQQGNANTSTLSASWVYNDADKAISCPACGVDIRSKRMYKDFDLRIQYKCSANQGLFYRTTVAYSKAYDSGVEFAIDDNTTQGDKKVIAGAAYALYEPTPLTYNHYADANPWNEVRLIVIGDSVEHWMNGVRVVKYKYFSSDYMARYNISKWATGKSMSFKVQGNVSAGPILEGYLGFQGDHGGNLEVRNMRIDTTPSWDVKYQWPPATVGLANGANAKAAPEARIAYQGDRVEISIPGESLRKATLVDLYGRTRGLAAISAEGAARFASVKENGLYFLKYENAAGAVRTAKVSLLASR